MVVPVFMINCQVSEYLKIGPVIPHITITEMAIINAVELPVAIVAQLANRSNKFFFLLISIMLLGRYQKHNQKKAPMFI